ncbi:hypothetical protein JCM6882_006247 [Rhodosporidiobolus microsporus]
MVYQQVGALSQQRKPNLDPPAREQPQLFQPGTFNDPTSRGSFNDAASARDKGKGRERGGNGKAGAGGLQQKKQAREAPQGNYKSYYLRRRAAVSSSLNAGSSSSASIDAPDPRLALLPSDAFKGKKVLDVGCNSGLVTVEVAQRWGAGKVTGVDVDAELVRAAKGNADLAWSRQAPLDRLVAEASYLTSTSRSSRQPHSRSRSASPSRSHSQSRASSPNPPPPLSQSHDSPSPFFPPSLSHFPIALPRQYGYLPAPRALLTRYVDQPEVETTGVLRKGKRKVMPLEEKTFPENVRFRCADWVEEKVQEDEEGYDVIIAFSITKWIHLTALNAGLLTFFRKCFTSLLPGGRLILEPQPFSSYARTLKNLRHNASSAAEVAELQKNLHRLEEGAEKGWRAEEGDFERVLLELVGFERRELVGYTGEEGTGWRRPVEVYTKRGGGSWGV